MTPFQHLIRQTDSYTFQSVLDIGTGSGEAARYFAGRGCAVSASGFDMAAYLDNPLPQDVTVLPDLDVCAMGALPDQSFDAVWCSHVLEHVMNVGQALAEIRRVLRPDGLLFLTVPDYSPFVVGGHVSPGWNLGIMMYVLILAGFDVRNGAFINHCWNNVAFVQKGDLPRLPLRHDRGDIETLAPLFPEGLTARQGMDGDILRHRWTWDPSISSEAEAAFCAARRRRRIHDLIPPVLRRVVRSHKLTHS